MRKKIGTSELRVGMVVVDTGLSWIEHPYLYSKPGVIAGEKDIARIRAEGYTEVFIAVSDGNGCRSADEDLCLVQTLDRESKGNGSTPMGRERLIPLREELGRAKVVYADSLRLVRDCLNDVRLGNRLDYSRSEAAVQEVIDSVMRNSDALISLTKLRSYDEYTYTHSINVAVITLAFARYLGLPESALPPLGLAALFHDLGKARIPDAILNKPAKLTEEEFAVIKRHPGTGVTILEEQNAVGDLILRGVGEHHEKFNGRGYPKGLAGDAISLFGVLISLADVYDALTSRRVYKLGIQPNKAMGTIFSMRGQDFPTEYVERFVKFLGIYPIGSMVQLSTGYYALVSSPNPDDPLHPNVKVILDRQQRSCVPEDLDLSRHKDDGPDGIKIIRTFDPKEFRVDPAQYLL